jgi:cytochrome c-type biogenesis protein CcmH
MTGFIVLTLVFIIVAAAFVVVPLWHAPVAQPAGEGASGARPAALIALLLFVFGTVGIYLLIGSRDWNRPAAGGSQIPSLVRHTQNQPDDVDGWIALGQAYSASQEFTPAIRAYSRANRLAGNRSAAALSGLGEALTLSGDASQLERAQELFEHALEIDPHSPKALFYSAINAYREGRLQVAHDRFAAMLALGPPENVRSVLQREIEAIELQLHPAVDAATAVRVHVTLAPALAARVPANAALFVFVRSPNGGPPLAVKRGVAQLPQDVELSSADAMIAGNGVKPGQEVTVGARISVSGSPVGASGDLYGELIYRAGKDGVRNIVVDRIQR